MILIGGWLLLLAIISLWCWWRHRQMPGKAVLKMMLWSIPLPYIANTAGWLVTEVGRQPWIIYGLQLTEQGISKVVPMSHIWLSFGGYTMIYAIMAMIALYFVRKIIVAGPQE